MCVCVCVCEYTVHVFVLENHGEVLKRGQLMGNQRKQRPWHCCTHWRLAHTHINVVKLWHVISSPLVTIVWTVIVTNLEPQKIARDVQLTTGRAWGRPGNIWVAERQLRDSSGRSTERCSGLLGDLTHTLAAMLAGFLLLRYNGFEQLIAFLNDSRFCLMHWLLSKPNTCHFPY